MMVSLAFIRLLLKDTKQFLRFFDGIFRLGHEVRPNLLVLSLISLRLHGLFGLVI